MSKEAGKIKRWVCIFCEKEGKKVEFHTKKNMWDHAKFEHEGCIMREDGIPLNWCL